MKSGGLELEIGGSKENPHISGRVVCAISQMQFKYISEKTGTNYFEGCVETPTADARLRVQSQMECKYSYKRFSIHGMAVKLKAEAPLYRDLPIEEVEASVLNSVANRLRTRPGFLPKTFDFIVVNVDTCDVSAHTYLKLSGEDVQINLFHW